MKRKGSKTSQFTSQEGEEKTEADAENVEDSKKGSEKDEAEEPDDDDDMFAYRVYFRKEEIQMASEMQERDQFEELLMLRAQTQNELAANPQLQQKFNIMDFTPREAGSFKPAMKKKKSSNNKFRKGGRQIEFDVAEEDPNFDEYLANFEKQKKDAESDKMTELKLHEMEKHSLE